MKDCLPSSIKQHLEDLGLKRGDNVLVPSRLFSFGQIAGSSPCATLYECLVDYLGPDATIAVPTYIFDGTVLYDPLETPAHASGVFSEYIRQLPEAVRSLCPIHSHAAVGPNSAILAGSDPTISFGDGSDFSAFYDNQFTLVMLGCGFESGGTYLHHLEALMNVPYRHWIDVNRLLVIPGKTEPSPIAVKYFARKDLTFHENFDVVVPVLRQSGALRVAGLNYGTSFAIQFHDLHAITAEMLAADPYFLVAEKDG